MKHDEIMADINDRIDRGIIYLEFAQKETRHPSNVARYGGKIEGLRLVKDWLRTYPNGAAAEPTPGGVVYSVTPVT